jgi:hypothetical protein
MGRTSKFSFPLPARTYSTTPKEKEATNKPSPWRGSTLSKAQRVLGAESDLNIDAQLRDDDQSWVYPGSRSSGVSGMSICISESSQSTRSKDDTASISQSQSDQWELESGVFPRPQRLRGKASSTLLGQNYGEDGGATETSSIGRRMHREHSDSTLRSYYDRQKSPLAISQQTSASSARDLALRKGCPPVVTRSPLLQIDSVDLPDEHLVYPDHEDLFRDKSKKKPSRLDLSMLIPRSRKNGGVEDSGPPTPYSTNGSNTPRSQDSSSFRRRLTKAPSKESLQSQKLSVRSGHTQDSKRRHTRDALSELYDKYEQFTGRSQRMSQIPESKVPEPKVPEAKVAGRERHTKTPQKAISELESRFDQLEVNSSHLSPADSRSFSWKNVPLNQVTPPWELSSAASISSRNTKTSRQTSTSAFSNSDLKNNSVLSLSSDSEEETSGPEPLGPHGISPNDRASRVLSGISTATPDSRRPSTRQSLAATSMTSITSKTYGSRRGSTQSHPSFTIPEYDESSLPNTRISGPCAQPDFEDHHSTRSQSSDRRQWRSSRKPSSTASRRSSTHPEPPISPTTVEFRDPSGRSSRYIAVTKQEEALLEALRQKRAHMREMIIEEHETAKSPPRESRRTSSRHAEVPFASTVCGPAGPKERVLLYLDDAPMSKEHPIDTAEPSPDLSDFLTFASDEDSTPRTSWAPSRKGQHNRPDSSLSPRQRRSSKNSPVTPPAVRLSAVGATGGLKDGRPMDRGLGPKVRVPHGGVRLMGDGRLANPQDFLSDEDDEMVIPWGA